jgi:hypothetical protein
VNAMSRPIRPKTAASTAPAPAFAPLRRKIGAVTSRSELVPFYTQRQKCLHRPPEDGVPPLAERRLQAAADRTPF